MFDGGYNLRKSNIPPLMLFDTLHLFSLHRLMFLTNMDRLYVTYYIDKHL